MNAARVVGFTALELRKLLPVAQQLLGKNIGAFADSKNLSPPLHHLQCLASIKGLESNDIGENVQSNMQFIHAMVLIACDNRDSAELVSLLSMKTLLSGTTNRDFDMIVAYGSLTEWRNALLIGGHKSVSPGLRQLFHIILTQFCEHGLKDVFSLTPVTTVKDPIAYLEYKP